MRTLLCFLLFLFCFKGNTQTSCNQSTFNPSYIYYGNSNTDFNYPGSAQLYLCGPNATVYDTSLINISTVNNHDSYINAGSTLIFKFPGGPYPCKLIVKNNATLILRAGTAPLDYYIIKEPLANIINQTGYSPSITTCSFITYPLVNCSVGIQEKNTPFVSYNIQPNPCVDILTIEIVNNNILESRMSIKNQIGETVLAVENFHLKNKSISVSELNNGVYFLTLTTKEGSNTKKFVVLR